MYAISMPWVAIVPRAELEAEHACMHVVLLILCLTVTKCSAITTSSSVYLSWYKCTKNTVRSQHLGVSLLVSPKASRQEILYLPFFSSQIYHKVKYTNKGNATFGAMASIY